MDKQYTPTYSRMWNRDFTVLTIAEMLLCLACYMTIPFLPYRLFWSGYVDERWSSLTMVAFVAGLWLSGFFGCWLIQRFRRNKVFCISALCLGAAIMSLSLFDNPKDEHADQTQTALLMAVCAAGGVVFGHAKRVLSCTLLIDKTESCHRTDANYAAIWTARLAVVAGPIIALTVRDRVQNSVFYAIGAAAAVVAALAVLTVKFPFRAPEEGTHILSTNRFFLARGWNVALVVLLMSSALGVMMATHASVDFFVSLVCGLAIAITTLHYGAVRTGRHTSAVGNTLTIAAVAAMALHNGLLDDTLKPMILGLGFGLTSSEQLYKLLGSCDHCQRSTAESTYFTASDGGLFLGIAAGWGGQHGLGGLAAHGERTAIALFAAATIVCSINAIVKRKHKEYHA